MKKPAKFLCDFGNDFNIVLLPLLIKDIVRKYENTFCMCLLAGNAINNICCAKSQTARSLRSIKKLLLSRLMVGNPAKIFGAPVHIGVK